MDKLFVVALLCMLGACAHPETTSKVDAAVVGLTLAEDAANMYKKLPACKTPKTMLVCSDATVVTKLQELDNKAYKAVKAAEANETLLDAAFVAIDAFTSVIPKVK